MILVYDTYDLIMVGISVYHNVLGNRKYHVTLRTFQVPVPELRCNFNVINNTVLMMKTKRKYQT